MSREFEGGLGNAWLQAINPIDWIGETGGEKPLNLVFKHPETILSPLPEEAFLFGPAHKSFEFEKDSMNTGLSVMKDHGLGIEDGLSAGTHLVIAPLDLETGNPSGAVKNIEHAITDGQHSVEHQLAANLADPIIGSMKGLKDLL